MTATERRVLTYLLAGYLRWYQALCLVAVAWVLVQPAGVAVSLPFASGWTLVIGGHALILAPWNGPAVAGATLWLPVSLWPFTLGALATLGVALLLRWGTRDG